MDPPGYREQVVALTHDTPCLERSMPDPRRKITAPLTVEQLETRETPSVTPLAQSFDTTAVGRLPGGWQQYSSNGQEAFDVSAAKALSGTQSLASTTTVSQTVSRAWYDTAQPANVEVS